MTYRSQFDSKGQGTSNPDVINLITKQDDLDRFCHDLAQYSYVCLDTEFIREKSYWPKLCLLQLAGPPESKLAAIIDPLVPKLDLLPLYKLLCQLPVMKVFHAGRQDMEIFVNLFGVLPDPIFDTQLAASVLGYGDQIAYDQLVFQCLEIRLDKSARLTDWSWRPLSNAALHYAIGDVVHLGPIYQRLSVELHQSGRRHWLAEEMAILTNPATYRTNPEEVWHKLKKSGMTRRQNHLLRRLAAWREYKAQERDTPRARIIRDDALLEISASACKTIEALERLRSLPPNFARSSLGSEVISLVNQALTEPEVKWPKPDPPPLRFNTTQQVQLELLKLLLKIIASDTGVAPKLIATTEDLEIFTANSETIDKSEDQLPSLPIMTGWRYEIYGQHAMALLKGQLLFGLHANPRPGQVLKLIITPQANPLDSLK